MGVFGFVYFIMPNTGCEAIIFFAVILSLRRTTCCKARKPP